MAFRRGASSVESFETTSIEFARRNRPNKYQLTSSLGRQRAMIGIPASTAIATSAPTPDEGAPTWAMTMLLPNSIEVSFS